MNKLTKVFALLLVVALASTALFDAPIYNNVLIGALSDVTPVADSGNIIV
jgi:hypothetical protein